MTVNGKLQRRWRRRRPARKTNAAAAAAASKTLGARSNGWGGDTWRWWRWGEGEGCTVFIIERDRWLLITCRSSDTPTPGRRWPGDGGTCEEHRAVVTHTCAMCVCCAYYKHTRRRRIPAVRIRMCLYIYTK